MCGITGYTGQQDASPVLMEGLKRLEYRGYDSSGIALQGKSSLQITKRLGKIAQLESALPRRMKGRTGIGHTRWATHGEPSDDNAHPLSVTTVVLPSCTMALSKTPHRCAHGWKRTAMYSPRKPTVRYWFT